MATKGTVSGVIANMVTLDRLDQFHSRTPVQPDGYPSSGKSRYRDK